MSTAAETSVLKLLEPAARVLVPVHSYGAEVPAPVAGARVHKGQALLGTLPEGGAAAVAPTSGRIVRLTRVTLTNGKRVDAVELEPDFEDRSGPETPHDSLNAGIRRDAAESLDKAGPDDLGVWIDRLRHAGVWADRRSSPDLLGQLHALLKRPVDTVVCNAVDHDPALKLQGTVAGRFGAVVATGVALLGRLTTARKVIVAVGSGSGQRWWIPLRRELRRDGVEVVVMPDVYPQADPTLLIYTMNGRRLRPGRLPVEQGMLLVDSTSAAAIGRAAAREQSMLRVPVGVRDHVRGRSSFLAVHVGTPVRHVLDHLQLPSTGITVLAGDVLRDQPIGQDAIIAGGELSLHVMRSRAAMSPDACIRCGWCAEACPTRVMPAGVLEAAQQRDVELAERYGMDACIECGICSWVCPAHLPLLGGVREMRKLQKE